MFRTKNRFTCSTRLWGTAVVCGAVAMFISVAPALADHCPEGDTHACTDGTCAGPASAAGIQPECKDGNPSCAQLGCSGFPTEETKIEPVASGTFDLIGGGTVTITVNNTASGQTFDWTSTRPMDCVFVKGGSNGNLYNYVPSASGDTGLHSPVNASNGKFFGLSHISFCALETISIEGKKEKVDDDGLCATNPMPLEGWTIELCHDANGNNACDAGELLATTTTNADGEYKFEGLAPGLSYIVCEVIPPRQPDENFNWVPCFPGDGNLVGDRFCYDAFTPFTNVTGKDFRNIPQVITCDLEGQVFCDEDCTGTPVFGLADVCVCVTQLDGPGAGTTTCVTTDGAGNFLVANLETGFNYRVEVDLDGSNCTGAADLSGSWVFTTPNPVEFFNDPNVAVCQADFGLNAIPTIECPPDVTVECDESTDPSNTGSATCNDACGSSSPSFSDAITSGSCPDEFTIKRTWTCTDDCTGETASCEQTINVVDTTAPEITCDIGAIACTDVDADVSSTCVGTVPFSATITDNCCVDLASVNCNASGTALTANLASCAPTLNDDGSVTVNGEVEVSSLTACPATLNVTIDAADCCGNQATQCSASASIALKLEVTPTP